MSILDAADLVGDDKWHTVAGVFDFGAKHLSRI